MRHISRTDRLIYSYAGIQGIYWMAYGTLIGFIAVFLLDRGFTNSSVGTLLALSSLFSVMLQPKIAAIADCGERFTLKWVMILLCAVTMIPMLVLTIPNLPAKAIAVCYMVAVLLMLSFQPLLSAMGMLLIQNGLPLNFGVCRSAGSFCFAILTFALGSIVAALSSSCLPIISCFIYVLLILLLLTFPSYRNVQISVDSAPSTGSLEIIKRNKRFFVLLVGITLIFTSHSSMNNYMFQILQSIGKGSRELGHMAAYTAVLEIPGMLFFAKFGRRWDCGLFVRITTSLFVAKAFFIAIATNMSMLYLGYGFQLISFAPFTPAVVHYVGLVIRPEDQVKGQALVAISYTLGTTIGSLLGGFLIEYSGVSTLNWVTTGFCIIGAGLILYGAQRTNGLVLHRQETVA